MSESLNRDCSLTSHQLLNRLQTMPTSEGVVPTQLIKLIPCARKDHAWQTFTFAHNLRELSPAILTSLGLCEDETHPFARLFSLSRSRKLQQKPWCAPRRLISNNHFIRTSLERPEMRLPEACSLPVPVLSSQKNQRHWF